MLAGCCQLAAAGCWARWLAARGRIGLMWEILVDLVRILCTYLEGPSSHPPNQHAYQNTISHVFLYQGGCLFLCSLKQRALDQQPPLEDPSLRWNTKRLLEEARILVKDSSSSGSCMGAFIISVRIRTCRQMWSPCAQCLHYPCLCRPPSILPPTPPVPLVTQLGLFYIRTQNFRCSFHALRHAGGYTALQRLYLSMHKCSLKGASQQWSLRAVGWSSR